MRYIQLSIVLGIVAIRASPVPPKHDDSLEVNTQAAQESTSYADSAQPNEPYLEGIFADLERKLKTVATKSPATTEAPTLEWEVDRWDEQEHDQLEAT